MSTATCLGHVVNSYEMHRTLVADYTASQVFFCSAPLCEVVAKLAIIADLQSGTGGWASFRLLLDKELRASRQTDSRHWRFGNHLRELLRSNIHLPLRYL